MYIKNNLYINDIEKILLPQFESFKNKNFLITGAGGLVGSFLTDTLMFLNQNYNYNIRIYATFTSENSFNSRFPSYRNNDLFIPIIQDITKPFNFDIDADYIAHTASNTHPALYGSQPVETIKLNIDGTTNILDFAKKSKAKRTIFLSTLEVYGKNSELDMFFENDIGYLDFNKPRACYPESKRLCETICQSYIQEYGLDICIARLGYIYGPTVKTSSSKADVQFLNNALNGEDIIMKSEGLQRRSYCYVADTVSALLYILLFGECGEAYNVASPNGNVLLRDYAETLSKLANVNLKFEFPTEAEKRGYSTVLNSTLNSEKLHSLGWKDKFDFEEGIEHTLEIKKDII